MRPLVYVVALCLCGMIGCRSTAPRGDAPLALDTGFTATGDEVPPPPDGADAR